MLVDHDAEYFTHRALSEMRSAAAARDAAVARIHPELADLLLERARDLVSDALTGDTRIVPVNAALRIAARR